MSYLISNIPQFKCWVRKEFTANHQKYHGEYLHALAFAVNTIPDRSLSFQVVFTGCETDLEDHPDELEQVQGFKLNFGEQCLLLVQARNQLAEARNDLEAKGYYKNWDPEYKKAVQYR